MESFVRELASQFCVKFSDVRIPTHAVLAKVFLLDHRYVLRGRPLAEQTIREFNEELLLIDRVRSLVPFEFPNPLVSITGERALQFDGWLWTIYPQLQGNILGTWQEGTALPLDGTKKVLDAMRLLHERTKGHFSAPKRLWLSQNVGAMIESDVSVLDANDRTFLREATDRIDLHAASLSSEQCCFVHGDFHHGNVLTDTSGTIVGLLDINWCRVGHPLEDLTYALTMFMSDYPGPQAFVFDDQRLQALVRIYDSSLTIDRFFWDMYALATAFDIFLFKSLKTEQAEWYAQHRLALLHAIFDRSVGYAKK